MSAADLIKLYDCYHHDIILTLGEQNHEIYELASTVEKAVEKFIRRLIYDEGLSYTIDSFEEEVIKFENKFVFAKVKVYIMFTTIDELLTCAKEGDSDIKVNIIDSEETWVKLCSKEEWDQIK